MYVLRTFYKQVNVNIDDLFATFFVKRNTGVNLHLENGLSFLLRRLGRQLINHHIINHHIINQYKWLKL